MPRFPNGPVMFVNPEIPPDALPRAEEVGWNALHPRFVRCRQAKKLVGFAVVVAVLGLAQILVAYVPQFAKAQIVFPTAWIIAVVRAVWSLAWPIIEVPRRRYAVRDKDILYKAGVLWRTETVVPFNRVQHAETGSGPIDRRFGLARLTVFTAGSEGGDLRIDGLGVDLAEQLRRYIVSRLTDANHAAQGEHATDTGPTGLA